MINISFIGCGNMGFAFASALSSNKEYAITLYSPHSAKAKAKKISVQAATSLEGALKSADIVVLAVKPQVLPSLYKVLSNFSDKAFISLAAGVPLEVLSKEIKSEQIARFMPNLAASEKASVTALCFSSTSSDKFKEDAFKIAKEVGSAFILDEPQFSAFIGISGSAIAFIFEFVHALALGGTREGIAYNTSVAIATETLESAAKVLKASGENPAALMSRVCSAGGTTIKGMEALYSLSFDSSVISAVVASCTKSIELEKSALERIK